MAPGFAAGARFERRPRCASQKLYCATRQPDGSAAHFIRKWQSISVRSAMLPGRNAFVCRFLIGLSSKLSSLIGRRVTTAAPSSTSATWFGVIPLTPSLTTTSASESRTRLKERHMSVMSRQKLGGLQWAVVEETRPLVGKGSYPKNHSLSHWSSSKLV